MKMQREDYIRARVCHTAVGYFDGGLLSAVNLCGGHDARPGFFGYKSDESGKRTAQRLYDDHQPLRL